MPAHPSDDGVVPRKGLQRSISTRVTRGLARRIAEAPPVTPSDRDILAAAVANMPVLPPEADR